MSSNLYLLKPHWESKIELPVLNDNINDVSVGGYMSANKMINQYDNNGDGQLQTNWGEIGYNPQVELYEGTYMSLKSALNKFK